VCTRPVVVKPARGLPFCLNTPWIWQGRARRGARGGARDVRRGARGSGAAGLQAWWAGGAPPAGCRRRCRCRRRAGGDGQLCACPPPNPALAHHNAAAEVAGLVLVKVLPHCGVAGHGDARGRRALGRGRALGGGAGRGLGLGDRAGGDGNELVAIGELGTDVVGGDGGGQVERAPGGREGGEGQEGAVAPARGCCAALGGHCRAAARARRARRPAAAPAPAASRGARRSLVRVCRGGERRERSEDERGAHGGGWLAAKGPGGGSGGRRRAAGAGGDGASRSRRARCNDCGAGRARCGLEGAGHRPKFGGEGKRYSWAPAALGPCNPGGGGAKRFSRTLKQLERARGPGEPQDLLPRGAVRSCAESPGGPARYKQASHAALIMPAHCMTPKLPAPPPPPRFDHG
jgi:hypothetical protein